MLAARRRAPAISAWVFQRGGQPSPWMRVSSSAEAAEVAHRPPALQAAAGRANCLRFMAGAFPESDRDILWNITLDCDLVSCNRWACDTGGASMMIARRNWLGCVALAATVLLARPLTGASSGPGRRCRRVRRRKPQELRSMRSTPSGRRRPARKPSISYAASSALAKQIEQGAPAQMFISADLDWMDYWRRRT